MAAEYDEEPAQRLDAKGLSCPMPILRTTKTIETMQPGEILEVETTDPGSLADFPSWASSTGNELLSAVDEGGRYRFRIRKSR